MKKKSFSVITAILFVSVSLLSGCNDLDKSTTSSQTATSTVINSTTNEETENLSETVPQDADSTAETESISETAAEVNAESESETGDTVYTGNGYTITIPPNWVKYNYKLADLTFAYVPTCTDGYTENITCIVQDLSRFSLDLDAYKDLCFEKYEQDGYTLNSNTQIKINNVLGYYITCTVEQNDTMCYMSQYFTIINNNAYVFTFAGDKDGYEKLADSATDIFNSIQFTPSTT